MAATLVIRGLWPTTRSGWSAPGAHSAAAAMAILWNCWHSWHSLFSAMKSKAPNCSRLHFRVVKQQVFKLCSIYDRKDALMWLFFWEEMRRSWTCSWNGRVGNVMSCTLHFLNTRLFLPVFFSVSRFSAPRRRIIDMMHKAIYKLMSNWLQMLFQRWFPKQSKLRQGTEEIPHPWVRLLARAQGASLVRNIFWTPPAQEQRVIRRGGKGGSNHSSRFEHFHSSVKETAQNLRKLGHISNHRETVSSKMSSWVFLNYMERNASLNCNIFFLLSTSHKIKFSYVPLFQAYKEGQAKKPHSHHFLNLLLLLHFLRSLAYRMQKTNTGKVIANTGNTWSYSSILTIKFLKKQEKEVHKVTKILENPARGQEGNFRTIQKWDATHYWDGYGLEAGIIFLSTTRCANW